MSFTSTAVHISLVQALPDTTDGRDGEDKNEREREIGIEVEVMEEKE